MEGQKHMKTSREWLLIVRGIAMNGTDVQLMNTIQHIQNDALGGECAQIGARKMIPAEEWHPKMADRAVYADREGMKELIREIQHNAQDVLQEKARVLCETTNPPSGGYDWIDELGGLFRVMRMQRDSEMKTLETYRAKLDQAQRERDELVAKCAKLEAAVGEILTAAQDKIDSDPDNQCPVCHCCGVELEHDGKGHRSDCLAQIALSSNCGQSLLDKCAKLEAVSQQICDTFEYPNNWPTTLTDWGAKIRSIYNAAREAMKP